MASSSKGCICRDSFIAEKRNFEKRKTTLHVNSVCLFVDVVVCVVFCLPTGTSPQAILSK